MKNIFFGRKTHVRIKIVYAVFLFIFISSCGKDNTTGSNDTNNNQHLAPSKTLALAPALQQTPEWCWAAVSEMTFRYYGLPNLNPVNDYQCGIIAVYFGPNSSCWFNCFSCVYPIGSMSELQRVVNQYGVVCQQLGILSKVLSSSIVFNYMNFNAVASEIQNNRPVIAGISPSGFALPNASQHVTLIVGYDATGPVPMLIINDPYPFNLPQFGAVPNPYTAVGGSIVQLGQYKVSFEAFVKILQWGNTIYNIR